MKPPPKVEMKCRAFEGYLKRLIEADECDQIAKVETFDQAGYPDRPVGLRIEYASGAAILLQIVRTQPPGGDALRRLPDYVLE